MPVMLMPHLARYGWAHPSLLSRWLGRPTGGPAAEAWFGTHPAGPTMLGDASGRPLADAVTSEPERYLGQAAGAGARLPWLVKLLAAGSPLSLQVHPDAARAASRFSAGHPSYSDPYGKPEVLVALTGTWALLGFDSAANAAARAARFGSVGLARRLADGPASAAIALWEDRELAAALSREVASGAAAHPEDPFAPVAATYGDDPALAVALALRPVFLPAGVAVEIPPGMLHAYLSGGGLEVMGASDNVLRGGLTPKHVDVDELVSVLDPSLEPVLFDADLHGVLPTAHLPCSIHRHLPVADPTAQAASTCDDAATAVTGPAVVWASRSGVQIHTRTGEMQLPAGAAVFVAWDESPVVVRGGSAFCVASTGR